MLLHIFALDQIKNTTSFPGRDTLTLPAINKQNGKKENEDNGKYIAFPVPFVLQSETWFPI